MRKKVILSSIVVMVMCLVSVFSIGLMASMTKSQERPEAAVPVPGYTFGSGGYASEQDAYNDNSIFFIKDNIDLFYFFESLSGKYYHYYKNDWINGGNADYSGKTVYLLANVTRSGTFPTNSDGDYIKTYFNGTFDGRGYTISYGSGVERGRDRNDKTYDVSGEQFGGLFDELGSGGTIRNLEIQNVKIVVDRDMRGAGGMVGTNNGTITCCVINSFHIRSHQAKSNCKAGGVVGKNNGSISNCMVIGIYQLDKNLGTSGLYTYYFRASGKNATNSLFYATVNDPGFANQFTPSESEDSLGDNIESKLSNVSTELDNNESAWVKGSWNKYNYYPRAFRWPSTYITFSSVSCGGVTFVPRLYTFYGGERVTEWDSNNEIVIPRPDYVDNHADFTPSTATNTIINAYSFTIYGTAYLVKYEGDNANTDICWVSSGCGAHFIPSQSRTITPELDVKTYRITFNPSNNEQSRFGYRLVPNKYINNSTECNDGGDVNDIVYQGDVPYNTKISLNSQRLDNGSANNVNAGVHSYFCLYTCNDKNNNKIEIKYEANQIISNLVFDGSTVTGAYEIDASGNITIKGDITITPKFSGGYSKVTFQQIAEAKLYNGAGTEITDTGGLSEVIDYESTITSTIIDSSIEYKNKDGTLIAKYEMRDPQQYKFIGTKGNLTSIKGGYSSDPTVNNIEPEIAIRDYTITFQQERGDGDIQFGTAGMIPKIYNWTDEDITKNWTEATVLDKDAGPNIILDIKYGFWFDYYNAITIDDGVRDYSYATMYGFFIDGNKYIVRYVASEVISTLGVKSSGAEVYDKRVEGGEIVQNSAVIKSTVTISPTFSGGYAHAKFVTATNTSLYDGANNLKTEDFEYRVDHNSNISFEYLDDFTTIQYKDKNGGLMAKYSLEDNYVFDNNYTLSVNPITGIREVNLPTIYSAHTLTFTPIDEEKFNGLVVPKVYRMDNGNSAFVDKINPDKSISIFGLKHNIDIIDWYNDVRVSTYSYAHVYAFTYNGVSYLVKYEAESVIPNFAFVSHGEYAYTETDGFNRRSIDEDISTQPTFSGGYTIAKFSSVVGNISTLGSAGYTLKKDGETVDINSVNGVTVIKLAEGLKFINVAGGGIVVSTTRNVDYYTNTNKYVFTITIKEASGTSEYELTYDIGGDGRPNNQRYELSYVNDKVEVDKTFKDGSTTIVESKVNNLSCKLIIREYIVDPS